MLTTSSNRSYLATMLIAISAVSLVPETANAKAHTCYAVNVPVEVPGIPNASLYGELCVPKHLTASTVQLLVHGGLRDPVDLGPSVR